MSSKNAKGIIKSTWTPLNHEDSNLKVFEERRLLVNKWFDMWNTNQRKIILEDLLMRCTGNQVEYAKLILTTKAIQNHVDFTRMLPRVICLYIFSFLDPRSLCRASQVCWYWKYLAEANEIWAPKCARLGWYFTGPINTMESGLWKRHFIDNIYYLQVTRPMKEQELLEQELTAIEQAKQAELEEAQRKARKLRDKQAQSQKTSSTPWRGPDPKPIDIVRNNYIDNDIDVGARVKLMHHKSNQKIRRFSANRSIGKDKSHMAAASAGNEDRINIPLSPISKMELEDIKSPMTAKIDSVPRPGPLSMTINGQHKTNSSKPIDNALTNQKENHEDGEIPSGRPWILPAGDPEDL